MYKFVLPKVIEVLPLYTIAGWDVYGMEIIVASIALGAFGYFNVKGTGLSGRMQFFFASVMVIAVVLITILVGAQPGAGLRSEERRVGKEWRNWCAMTSR